MIPKDCPIGPRRKRSPKKNLEGGVVRECLKFLELCPNVVYTERRNTGAVQFQDEGFIRFGQRGAADIWCLVKKHLYEMDISDDLTVPTQSRLSDSYIIEHVEIECKRADGKGRQSVDQKRFQEFCDNHYIPYILTTSASELAEKIEAIACGRYRDNPA